MMQLKELTPELTEITDGLRFPEGPIAMQDGSVIVVEMFGERLTLVHPDGTKDTVAEIEGGPNGAAIGPDGAVAGPIGVRAGEAIRIRPVIEQNEQDERVSVHDKCPHVPNERLYA